MSFAVHSLSTHEAQISLELCTFCLQSMYYQCTVVAVADTENTKWQSDTAPQEKLHVLLFKRISFDSPRKQQSTSCICVRGVVHCTLFTLTLLTLYLVHKLSTYVHSAGVLCVVVAAHAFCFPFQFTDKHRGEVVIQQLEQVFTVRVMWKANMYTLTHKSSAILSSSANTEPWTVH